METHTLILSGTSSVLQMHFFPAMEFAQNEKYVLGLAELCTYNTIPNIDDSNNKFYVGTRVIALPTGNYKIDDIGKYLKRELTEHNAMVSLRFNSDTLRSEIESNDIIDFTPQDSIGRLLGFESRILEPGIAHTSDQPANISKNKCLSIECNIINGTDKNGQKKKRPVHEFSPNVPPGYKIIEKPSDVSYLPVSVRSMDYLELRIVDQNGNPVDFRGEFIHVKLHLKPD